MNHNKMTEQNNNKLQQLLRIPTGWRKTSWLFTSAAKKLNQGLPGSNSTSGQTGLEPGISRSQGKHPNHWATLPPTIIHNELTVYLLNEIIGLFNSHRIVFIVYL